MNALEKITACAVIPVIKIEDASDAPELARALYAGGLTCAEVTFRTAAAAKAISLMKETAPELCIGAGTVCDDETCKAALEAGAEFIVSPGCPAAAAEYCRENNVTFIPGVSTANELITALSYGCKHVKFFPAEACGGIKTLKALAAPFPGVKFMPTGGIKPENMSAYLALHEVFAVGASFIAESALIKKHDFEEIKSRASAASAVRQHREEKPEIKRRDTTKGKIVTLGEIMLRLSPPGYERAADARGFEVVYGGAEANAAISLCVLGEKASFVTKLPDNALGTGALRTLRRYGVDTDNIIIGGKRLGIYIYEKGFGSRGASVTYDRAGSSFAESAPREYDWESIFNNASWFHFTGITPALSDTTLALTHQAVKEAKRRGITVSCDLNYRSKLWGEEDAARTMKSLMEYVDVFIGNEEHTAALLGMRREENEENEAFLRKLREKFGFSYAAMTYRRTITPEHNTFRAAICGEEGYADSGVYDVRIAERVGGGDAFAAGLIHMLINGAPLCDAVQFAAAACAVKHSIPGDFSTASETEITSAAKGGSAEVKR